MWNHLETKRKVRTVLRDRTGLNVLDGSMGAGGRLEAGGMEVYRGSSLGVNPGELRKVTLRLKAE